MVFESVVIELLNRYLKPYVKKLDTSQLKVGVWKGHARLDKLELKEDLLSEAMLEAPLKVKSILGVPLKIKRSFIGNLEMKIPWKRLTKDTLQITIDEVYVILGPDFEVEYDAERELKRKRKDKEQKIEEFEEVAKKKKQKEKEAKKGKKKKKKDSEKPDTFVQKLVVHMTKNLQVKVRDIHVRYEDSVTSPPNTAAGGITLHSLELKSTDADWAPCVVRETATLIYKLIELNSLGLYWNNSAESLASADLSMDEMIEKMRENIARPAMALPPCNAYLLQPMSATAKLKLNLKTGVDLSQPEMLMGVECEDIMFTLRKEQLAAVLHIVESFNKHSLNLKYLKYKPVGVSLSEDAGGWWRYAITAVLEEDVKRRAQMWSWKHIKQHRETCRLYQQKYHEKLHSINVSSSLLAEIQTLEDSLDWFNIVICRRQASKKEKQRSKRGVSPSSSYQTVSKAQQLPLVTTPTSTSPSTSTSSLLSPTSPQASFDPTRRVVESKSKSQKKKELKEKEKEEKKGKKKGFFSNLKKKLKHSDGTSKRSKQKQDDGFVLIDDKGKGDTIIAGASAAALDSAAGDDQTEPQEEDAATPPVDEEETKERREFYQAIGYVEGEDYIEYPKDYVAQEIHVTLKTVSVELIGAKQLGTLVTKNISANIYNRPSSQSVSVDASVSSLTMSGVPGPDNSPTTLVTSNVEVGVIKDAPLVEFQLEMNPLTRPEMDVMVKAALRPIQITYDFETVNGLIDMFKPPKLLHFQELTQAASATWDQLKSQTTAGLQEALKNRKQLEVDVTLQSPYLLLPEKGRYSKNSNLLIVDLGKLSLFGSTKDPKSIRPSSPTADDLDSFYDSFTIKLNGMQVLVAEPGMNWSTAMSTETESSPLHILDPTGFEIQLLKSIVKDDAYLPSLRVEGTISGFEVKVSDKKLATLVKVGSSLEKPPALITKTTIYDNLPAPRTEKHVMDNISTVADIDTISLDSTVLGSTIDDDDEDSECCSLSTLQQQPTKDDDFDKEKGDTAQFVFTDVSIKLTIKQIALKLTQTEVGAKSVTRQKPILDIVISNLRADVVDRKWDTQGNIMMGDVAVLDHVTPDSSGQPTYLLKTQHLNDGNFVTARFVSLTKVGIDFAHKYSGLENTFAAQLSLVRLTLNQQTVTTLLHYFMALKPVLASPSSVEDINFGADHLEPISELEPISTFNPKDVQEVSQKELSFDVQFVGVDVDMIQDRTKILQAGVTGFIVTGKVQSDKTSINASVKDISVKDPTPNPKVHQIITRSDWDKDILYLNVVQFNKNAHQRDPHDMSWVDTSLKMEANRINVNLSPSFLANILGFVKKLNLNSETFQSAAKASADTAAATATAIVDSMKTAHRLQLDLTLHAPIVFIPFKTKQSEGGFYIDLGDFHVSNQFKHGHELLPRASMYEVKGGMTILDCMNVHTTSVQIFRKSHVIGGTDEQDSIILEPLQFTAQVTRNIGIPTESLPNVDVNLELQTVKFHIHEEDVQALIQIGISLAKLGEIMSSPPKKQPAAGGRTRTTIRKKNISLLSSKSVDLGRQRSRTRTISRLRRSRTISQEEVTNVRVKATINTVSFDLTTTKAPLLKATASGLNSEVSVINEEVAVCGSADSLSVEDLGQDSAHSKVVSLAEDTNKVSSLQLTIFLSKERDHKAPIGKLKANIAQMLLIVNVPFVLKLLGFVQRLDIDPSILKTAAKTAQDGALAVSSATQDKYFKIDVTVHAPVLVVPLSDQMEQGLMVDLGSVNIENTLLVPDPSSNVAIDAYGVKLDSFKVSRVLLDFNKTGSPVTAERVLLQPFHMLLAVERNLCPWYTSVPTVAINLNMGELKIFLGQDDLEKFARFGKGVGEKVANMIAKMKETIEADASAELEASLEQGEEEVCTLQETPEYTEESFDKLMILSSLSLFQLKVFSGEPSLDAEDEYSQDLSQLQDFALASLQLVTMDMKVKLQSNDNVEVQASMKDIALCDEQKERQSQNIGNRVIQHYTSNPLQAYTGVLDKPVVSISYLLRDNQHIVLFSSENLLVLSDVEFLRTVADYFKSIAETILEPKPAAVKDDERSEDLEETLTAEEKKTVTQQVLEKPKAKVKKAVAKKKQNLPKLKFEGSIKNLRVSLVEAVDEPKPQALTLKVSTYIHFQLTETSKQASLNVVDLGVATSSFFDLDNVTSWVLYPCSLMVSMTGPLEGTAMDINGTLEPVSLKLSPAVVRLIIHAVQTLTPKEEPVRVAAPRDLWEKKLLHESNLWFFAPVPLHKALTSEEDSESKNETITFTIESVEVILESETTSRSVGHPLLAVNVSAVIQVFDITGNLSVDGTIQCEASYYNEHLSLWEPVLEPLEDREGRQHLWEINLAVTKTPPKELQSNGSDTYERQKPQFTLGLSSTSPLQITLTKTSLQLIKTLAEAYTKEYGKQVEGSANLQSLTGAPFTVVNRLGKEVPLCIQPGAQLKFKDKKEFVRLSYEESVDLLYKRDVRKRSYASLVVKRQSEVFAIDIAVGSKFRHLKNVVIDTPGHYYYTLVPKDSESLTTYGLVVDVAVTGTKKTITVRSPVQIHNHLMIDVDILTVYPQKASKTPVLLRTIKQDQVFAVPIDVAQSNEFYVRPSGFGYEPVGPPIMWFGKKDSDYFHFKSVLPGDESACHFIRVDFKEEKYKVRRNIPAEDYAHHVIHLYPPLVFQNLLPFEIFVESMESRLPSRSIKSGQFIHIHDLDLEKMPHVTVSVVRQHATSLKGKFQLAKKPKDYFSFVVAAAESTPIELTVHTENLGYLKMGLYCPFWMVNKTDVTLKYKEGPSVVQHPPDSGIQLFSTSSNNSKSKIQLGAITERSTHTDWTKSFTLNAVGTGGNFSAKLGETSYRFGVEVRLSQFTLTKLVIVTPYYLLVNETEFDLKIREDGLLGNMTSIPSGEISPFWPLTDSTKLILVAGEGEDQTNSAPFNYRRSDHTVLRFDGNNEVVAVCVEIQESESATIVTFSPYYPGCAPVYIINHFPDMTLRFAQETRSPLAIAHTLSAREAVQFTWDDPSGRKVIKWDYSDAKVQNCKPVDISKDSQGKFVLKFAAAPSPSGLSGASFMRNGSKSSISSFSVTSPPPARGIADDWLAVDESLSETLVPGGEEDGDSFSENGSNSPSMSLSSASITSRGSLSSTRSYSGVGAYRGYWMSFIDGLQRVLIFTPDEGVIQHIKAVNSYSVPLFEASLSLRAVGISLVDNDKKRELAYIAVQQSGVIWQVDKGKKIWKTLNNTVITILEEAYQNKKLDLKQKNLVVNLETMEMYSPVRGKLRRTHHDGVFVKFALSEQDYSVQAKVGHVQVDNQLPFSVYPQVLYPLPPPPTVASTTEPKPFVEVGVILRKNDQSNVKHFKYVHVLVQKMAVNVDLGFILALVDFFSLSSSDAQIETEYVKRDIEYVGMSLKETIIPELSDDFNISRSFFDVLHLSPIKVTLSFNIRSVGKNKSEDEITVGDRFLQLFLHSIGVILTSVQETEMKFSCFHLEYQPQTGRGLKNLLIKHYRTQGLFQLHTIIFGLDVLGNPVSVVRGVVEGAVDLFYEPFKGSVLGPEEFFEGLGIGLKSFFAAGVVGGITGAGARITGAIGDVWAKLTFDDEFIDRRQQAKTRPPKMGLKLGGFAKNFFEGVTGVVTQPVKGLQKEGAVGLLKGTGRGLVGLLVRPTGGLVDLASGTLDFVTRKTQVGNTEISDIRPPRFIARDGVIAPYSPSKAIGTALLVALDEGKYVESDYYFGHLQVSTKPIQFVLVTDRHFMRIERRVLTEGWKCINCVPLCGLAMPVEMKDVNVVIHYKPDFKEKKLHFLTLQSEELAKEVKFIINESYYAFLGEQ